MARIDPIPRERMTEEQRRVHDIIAAGRTGGTVAGPFPIWLRTAELAERAAGLLTYLRRQTSVPVRLSELAVLITARAWTAQYEWATHERHALNAGIEPAVVEAIKHRKTPVLAKEDEAVVYALATELHERHTIGDGTYARAVSLLGEQAVIDLVTVIGFFTMVAAVLVAFEVPIPDGRAPPLPA